MNELTAAAIAAYIEEVRIADQVVRNVERRRIWAERWREHTGAYPESYNLAALAQQLYTSTRGLLFGLAGEPAQAPEQTAELLIHPTFLRRRRVTQSNQGLIRFPHYRRQIKRAKIPEPPAVT
jgi:hypothetical protein